MTDGGKIRFQVGRRSEDRKSQLSCADPTGWAVLRGRKGALQEVGLAILDVRTNVQLRSWIVLSMIRYWNIYEGANKDAWMRKKCEDSRDLQCGYKFMTRQCMNYSRPIQAED